MNKVIKTEKISKCKKNCKQNIADYQKRSVAEYFALFEDLFSFRN